MVKKKKVRLNLYVSNELVDFAKEWSYVIDMPISKMLEEYLQIKKDIVPQVSPFQWLSDPVINPSLAEEEGYLQDMAEYINNKEEEDFCRENPRHLRAKIRQKLKGEYEKTIKKEKEKQKKREREIIQRWMETFPV